MNESEIQAYLEHHGVKGMKWGVHRNSHATSTSSPGPTKDQIKSARAGQLARRQDYYRAKASGDAVATKKAEDAFNNSKDRVVAAHMTKGEKWASAFFGGVGGTGANVGTNLKTGKLLTQQVINSELGVLTIPVQARRAKKIGNVQIQKA